MRRITLWVFSTVVLLVLLFSYRTSLNSGAATAAAPLVRQATPNPTTTTTSPKKSSTSKAGVSGTYSGSVAQTRWGPVQVSITVANGRITSVSVPVYPNGNGRDAEINSYALPILRQETVDAQSANIDTVSGATVTSDGYLQSLQAAIDAAHL